MHDRLVSGGSVGPQDASFPRLVSLAAHDLRTPLATIHGFAQTLIRMGDLGDPNQRYVEMSGAAAFAQAALRHGGLEQVDLRVDGATLTISPVTPSSGPVLLGDELRDLGAAVAVRVVRALGGSVELDGDTLTVRLPE